jgi:hypothetical protein
MSDKTGKAALVVGTGAITLAAAALTKSITTAANSGIDSETIALIQKLNEQVAELNQSIQSLSSGENDNLYIQGYPPNVNDIQICRIVIAAINTSYQLPDIDVPDNFQLVIKAWPTNAGTIYVGKSDTEARDLNQVYPLVGNDSIAEAVTNANLFYVSGTNVNDCISVFVGHRK